MDSNKDELAGDLLFGANAIRAFLVHLGMPERVDPYYLKRAGHWPIGKTGASLIASKRRLTDYVTEITAPRLGKNNGV